MKAIFNLSSYA